MIYLECYKDGIKVRRVDVTLCNPKGQKRIEDELRIDGFNPHRIESEEELETGWI